MESSEIISHAQEIYEKLIKRDKGKDYEGLPEGTPHKKVIELTPQDHNWLGNYSTSDDRVPKMIDSPNYTVSIAFDPGNQVVTNQVSVYGLRESL